MKNSRFQFEYRDSASQLHRKVGDILRDSTIFGNYQIYQEYPVVRVNTDYINSSHHFDWVIMDIHLVIECHGSQHYIPTDFSGKAEDGGIGALQDIRRRDNEKKIAALEAGFTYIEISYTDEKRLSEQYIWDRYQENKNEDQLRSVTKVVREEDPAHRQRLDRAKQYRQDSYRRAKARRMEIQSRRTVESSLQSQGTGKDKSS